MTKNSYPKAVLLSLMLLISASSFSQTFWGMTSNDDTYDGGTLFSFNVQTNTYHDEYVFKPNPVFGAMNVFEESPGIYVGICNQSFADGVHNKNTHDALYRYYASKDSTEIVALFPGDFIHAQYHDGDADIIYFKNSIIGMIYPDGKNRYDSMVLINYSVPDNQLEKVAVFNKNTWPGEGNTSYSPNNCYFTPVNDTTIVFCLSKSYQYSSSDIRYAGQDFFHYNPQTGRLNILFSIPDSITTRPRGAFIKTTDGRLLGIDTYGIAHLNLADSSYSVDSVLHASNDYMVAGELFQVTDSTVVALHSYSKSGFLMEYDFIHDTLLHDVSVSSRSGYDYNRFALFGDSIYFSTTKYYPTIMAYKPGTEAIKVSMELTNPAQRSIKYLKNTSNPNSILSFYRGLSDYYPLKHAYVNKVRFGTSGSATEAYKQGANPASDLLLASDGMLYGMSPNGGAGTYYHGDGVLFEMNPQTKEFRVLVNFTGKNGGFGDKNKYGTLYQKGQNNLLEYHQKIYGTTYTNGDYSNRYGPGYGVVFTYDISRNYDNFRKIYDFNINDEAKTGRLPMSGLTLGANDKLYGTTFSGGANGIDGHGVLYEIDPAQNNTFRVVLNIPDTCLRPEDNLVLADNGKLYGLATNVDELGNNKKWAIREYDAEQGTFSDIYFSTEDYEANYSQFLFNKGKLYGVVAYATDEPGGYLFEFDLSTHQMVQRVVFPGNGEKGTRPQGNLMLSSTGSLWGMTKVPASGEPDNGVIYEFNPTDTTLTHHAVSAGTGRIPLYTCLTEVEGDHTSVFNTKTRPQIQAYPNPTADRVKFVFENNDFQQVSYFIYDASGRMLAQASAQVRGYVMIDFAGFKPGVYFVKLNAGGKSYSQSIIRK